MLFLVLILENELFYNFKIIYGSSICFYEDRYINCYKYIFCRCLSRLILFYFCIFLFVCKDYYVVKLGE